MFDPDYDDELYDDIDDLMNPSEFEDFDGIDDDYYDDADDDYDSLDFE